MPYRKLSIYLFITIGLLVSAKTGFSLLNSYQQSIATETVNPQIEQLKEAQPTSVAVSRQTQMEESLAMIEEYIIPHVEAAPIAEASSGSSALPYEDKTLTSLRSYKETLDTRAKGLEAREKSIKEAEEQIKQRITELEQLEASIQQRLNDEQKIKSKKVKRLTAVFEGMKPEKAAPVVAKMELKTVVKVFLLMNEKKVGKILSFLPPDKAVLISQALTRQISSVK